METFNNCTVVWRKWTDYRSWLFDNGSIRFLNNIKQVFGDDNIVSIIEVYDKYEQRGDYLGVILKDGTCGIFGERRYMNGITTITVYEKLTLEQMHGKLIILNYAE